ncbi:MAG: energy transducer TonB [Proteobacteria bacterium]|nr:energy transducer TonB [Pseudomonadota bacterium]
MADVLIVCVREDEPQAKALAEMFEAAGFTIGGAPSSDGALRSSGAGVIVWSQASIRSRPFLDAAQRVINADKAVVASLIEPPPPSSVGNSPSFDLSDWAGDPNDPSLDPLFFAVDRMVNSQRAAAGAATIDEPPAYEPPPPPPSPRAAPASRPSASAPPRSDVLQSESEHWRAIRDSRNPADFMDYLARYGPDGAFSEVAELRLKQLTAAPERGQPRPRMDAPPARRETQRREPSVRPPPPPPRRVMETPPSPPPPTRRFDALRPQSSYDRGPPRASYNERSELRDPPKGEGGPLRAFVLIALLGGVALAGGLYFGNGGFNLHQDNANQPSQEPATAPSLEPPSAEQTSGSSLSQLATSGRAVPLAPAPAPRRQEVQPQRAASPPREAHAAPSTPPNSTRTNATAANTSSGGPISLFGPQSHSQTQGGPVRIGPQQDAVPLGPQQDAPPPTVVAMNTPPAASPPTAAATPGAVRWTARPTARRIADLYPSAAARQGAGGRVELNCTVTSSLGLACVVATETPPGLGFARAAIEVSNAYRVAPTLSDGSGAVGARTHIAVQFQAPPQ